MEDSLEVILFTKKGKPRKRKPKEPRVYFTQDTEDAIVRYLAEIDQDKRNEIYNKYIAYSFYKLAENIIHTFKFYYTDTNTIEDLKHEVVTFLLEKLHLYNQSKGKAYSYFGTIAKRYLIVFNNKNYQKLQERVDINEVNKDEDNPKIVHIENFTSNNIDLNHFINLYVDYITLNIYKLFPKERDAQVADAILELFRKRETLSILETSTNEHSIGNRLGRIDWK